MNKLIGLVLCVILGLAVHSDVDAALIVFGDSLSDEGNLAQASLDNPQLATDPQSPPYDAQGRLSNGPIWVDYLADRLGAARPTASLRGGTDYAYAGALTGNGQTLRQSVTLPPFTQLQMVDNIGLQINNYLTSHPSGFAATDIVLLWGGANDLALATLAGPVNGPGIVSAAIANLQSRLITLNANGATRVVVPNQINASVAPFWNPLWNPSIPSNAPAQFLSALTQAFNTGLDGMLTNLEGSPGFNTQIIEVDIASALGDLPALGLSNTTAPFLYDPTPGKQVSDYVFWDLIHPTTQVHQLIGDRVYAAVIPEPASACLLLSGIALLALGRFRRSGAGASPPS